MRWDRLSLLTDRLGEDVKRFGYESFPVNMADKTFMTFMTFKYDQFVHVCLEILQ